MSSRNMKADSSINVGPALLPRGFKAGTPPSSTTTTTTTTVRCATVLDHLLRQTEQRLPRSFFAREVFLLKSGRKKNRDGKEEEEEEEEVVAGSKEGRLLCDFLLDASSTLRSNYEPSSHLE
ncbi:hypothetical protein M0804_002173 [Polistes exclamans]|nr:hypothetical protein M0804_002173 [Polistes exclamans]